MIIAVAATPHERAWAVLNAEEAVMGIVRAALGQGQRLFVLADEPLAWAALAAAEEHEDDGSLRIVVRDDGPQSLPDADAIVYIGPAKRVNVSANAIYAIASSGAEISEARRIDEELAREWQPGEREESLPAIPLAMQLIVESLRY